MKLKIEGKSYKTAITLFFFIEEKKLSTLIDLSIKII